MYDRSAFEKAGNWVSRGVMVYVVLLVLETIAAIAAFTVLRGAVNEGSAGLSPSQASLAGGSLIVVGYIAYVEIAVYIVIAILFLRLLYRSVQRAKEYATPFTYVSPGWAVGYWFVPLVNLYRPYRNVKALFEASAQEPGVDKQAVAGEQLLSGWWGFLLLSSFLGWGMRSYAENLDSLPKLLSYTEIIIGYNVLLIVSTLFFALVARKLSQTMMSVTGAVQAAG